MPSSLKLLRWVAAAVSAVGAAQLLIAVAHGHGPGLPVGITSAVAAAEVVAAVLFVLPGRAGRTGAILLLAVYAVALVVHLVHGDHGVAPLVVLAAAVWAVLKEGR